MVGLSEVDTDGVAVLDSFLLQLSLLLYASDKGTRAVAKSSSSQGQGHEDVSFLEKKTFKIVSELSSLVVPCCFGRVQWVKCGVG